MTWTPTWAIPPPLCPPVVSSNPRFLDVGYHHNYLPWLAPTNQLCLWVCSFHLLKFSLFLLIVPAVDVDEQMDAPKSDPSYQFSPSVDFEMGSDCDSQTAVVLTTDEDYVMRDVSALQSLDNGKVQIDTVTNFVDQLRRMDDIRTVPNPAVLSSFSVPPFFPLAPFTFTASFIPLASAPIVVPANHQHSASVVKTQ